MQQIKIGVIGGTGLGQALGTQGTGTVHEPSTPFGPPSSPIVEVEWDGLPLLLLTRHGAAHLLQPSQVPYRANIFALKQLGCTHILASGAVGSLREEFRPRDLVIPDQIIDKTVRRAGTFFESAAVHVEFAEPFCPVLRQILIEAGQQAAQAAPEPAVAAPGTTQPPVEPAKVFALHDHGCYVCMEGPAFSTRAESLMHRLWGGDLIGMTAMPEAKLAREAEISYASVSLVTDYDCWRNRPGSKQDAAVPAKAELLAEIMANLQAATGNAMQVIRRAVALLAERREAIADCPAHHALELAIWSDKSRIAPEEVQRLAPLWGRYFAP